MMYKLYSEEYKKNYTGKDITKDKKYMRLIQKVSEAETLFGTFIDNKIARPPKVIIEEVRIKR